MNSDRDDPFNIPNINVGRSRSLQAGGSGSRSVRAPRSTRQAHDLAPPSTSRLGPQYHTSHTNPGQGTSSRSGGVGPRQAQRTREQSSREMYPHLSSHAFYPGGEIPSHLANQGSGLGYSGSSSVDFYSDTHNLNQYNIYGSSMGNYHSSNYSLPYPQYSSGDSVPFGQPDVPPLLDDYQHGGSQAGNIFQQPEQDASGSYNYPYASLGQYNPEQVTFPQQGVGYSAAIHPSYQYHYQGQRPPDEYQLGHAYIDKVAPNMPSFPHSSQSHEDIPPPIIEQTPIPPPHPYEYTLQLDPAYLLPEDDIAGSLYLELPNDHRSVITDRVAQTRPFHSTYITHYLAVRLTARDARDILSDDVDQSDHAALLTFPDPVPKSDNVPAHVTWMSGLENWQKREVIRRLVEITLQGAEKIRDWLLTQKIQPFVSRAILNAKYEEEVRQIVDEYDLIVPPEVARNTKQHPWQRGMSALQKAALRQRMMRWGCPTPNSCYNLLNKPKVPEKYGTLMLRANEEDFRLIMDTLKSPSKVRLPFS
ncbi:hypothetical protein CBS101457_000199 [Exobasidium rhododendri]|nr:hypothetical protein CBS101457_000199 [Exobasidium rhododendri]